MSFQDICVRGMSNLMRTYSQLDAKRLMDQAIDS